MARQATRGIFVSVLLSYFVVMAITAVAFLFIARTSIQEARDAELRSVTLQLERGRDLMEARFEEIRESAVRMGGDRMVAAFSRVSSPLRDRDYFSILQLAGQFERFNLSTSFVDSVYLVFRRSGTVVSSSFAAPDLEWLYPHFLQYDDLAFDVWQQSVDLWSSRPHFHRTAVIRKAQDQVVRAVTYVVPIAVTGIEPQLALFVLIPEASIRSYFGDVLSVGADLEITTADGELLYSTRPVGVQPARATPVPASGGSSGLTYTARVPDSYLESRIRLVRRLFTAIIVAATLASVLAAVFFALRNTRPFLRFHGLLVRSGVLEPESENVRYSDLERSLERLVGRRVDIEKGIERRKHLLRLSFYERLLRGGFSDEQEARDYLRDLAVPGIGFPAVVAIVACEPHPVDPEGPVGEVIVHKVLMNRGNASWILHRSAEGEVLILPGADPEVEHLVGLLQEVRLRFGVTTTVAIGSEQERLLDLRDSFSEATQALRTTRRDWSANRIVRYDLGGAGRSAFPYGAREEGLLVHAVQSRDSAALESAVDAICGSGLERSGLSTPEVESLFSDITASVAKIVIPVESVADGLPENPIRYLQRYASADDFRARLKAVLVPLCTNGCCREKSHAEELAERAVAHVRANYADPMFSLESMSDALGLNPQYVSRFFKEHVGVSFSRFLQDTRMNAVEQAMRTSDAPLDAIASAAGYQSPNSFYKAFRRHYGTTPGRFRREITAGRP